MNDFDRTARHATKLRPAVVMAWMFPRLRHLNFAGWHDSQSAPRPGEPDRRCDTLAELIDPEGRLPPWTAVIELFTEADADALDRGIEYVGRFRRELRHGPHGTDRYHFALALVFLTTVPEETEVMNALPGHEADVFFNVRPQVLALRNQDGLALMDRIEHNPTLSPLLAWVSLMKGGQTLEAAQRRRALAEREPDLALQKTLGSLVLIFAELTDSKEVWLRALEGFAVRESTFLREARMEGRAESYQDTVLRTLQVRFSGTIPAQVERRVRAQADLAVLRRWFDLALTSPTLEAFETGLSQ